MLKMFISQEKEEEYSSKISLQPIVFNPGIFLLCLVGLEFDLGSVNNTYTLAYFRI